MQQEESRWQTIKVDWAVDGERLTFTRFGAELMKFMRDQAWEYEGVLNVEGHPSTAHLDGVFSVPTRLTDDEFWSLFVGFCEQHGWQFGGGHRLLGVGD